MMEKCVWATGRGRRRVAAYSDGTVSVGSSGTLVVTISVGSSGTLVVTISVVYPGVDSGRFCSAVDVVRGFHANKAERQMLGDALRAARRAAGMAVLEGEENANND